MTTINILIYTDTLKISEDVNAEMSISFLKSLIKAKSSAVAEYKLQVINRYEGFEKVPQPEMPVKLTREILKAFDEIWFFGTYQINYGNSFCKDYGGSDNELDDEEVKVIEEWMNAGGGVLMAGDHSLPRPGEKADCSKPETYICMGKALGYRVPRAGELRKWDGPPTDCRDNTSFNTLGADLMNYKAQEDNVPQMLQLVRQPDGSCHRLFIGKDKSGAIREIEAFPDHIHEGEVVKPDVLGGKWPSFPNDASKSKPGPTFIASGCDKRFGRFTPVLAVYDGDLANVGRIVADSSWHHYLDVNLKGLITANEERVWGLLSQFYGNLALYLCPLAKRQELARSTIDLVAHHADVMEERGNDPVIVGTVALSTLKNVVSEYDAGELLQAALPPPLKIGGSFRNFGTLASEITLDPPVELALGSIINTHYEVTAEAAIAKAGESSRMSIEDVITRGFSEAIRIHRDFLRSSGFVSSELVSPLEKGRLNNLRSIPGGIMSDPICSGLWSKCALSTELDGTFMIFELDSVGLFGLHVKSVAGVHVSSVLTNIRCDGQTISFQRTDPLTGQLIEYMDGKITPFPTVYRILGKFRKTPADLVMLASDDWTAEKPT